MKKYYEEPALELLMIEERDVIRTSGNPTPTPTPPMGQFGDGTGGSTGW